MKSVKYFFKSIHLPIQGYGSNPWSRKLPHVCHSQGGLSQIERNEKIKRTRPCTQPSLVSSPTLWKLCRGMQDCHCLDPCHLRWGYSPSLLTGERGSSCVSSLMCLPFAWQTKPPFPPPKLSLYFCLALEHRELRFRQSWPFWVSKSRPGGPRRAFSQEPSPHTLHLLRP